MTKTSLGPNGKQTFIYYNLLKKGMKKMVVNHIDKIFVTSDAATILREVFSIEFF